MKRVVFAFLVSFVGLPLAHANGVEKILADDAHGAQISDVALGWQQHGEKLESDGVDGPVYQLLYRQALEVTVTYQSADQTDIPTYPNNDGQPTVDPGAVPTVYFYLPVTDDEVKAIKAGTLKPSSLVQLDPLGSTTVQVDDANYQYKCSYDDYNQPLYGCVEPPVPTHPEQRKVLIVERK